LVCLEGKVLGLGLAGQVLVNITERESINALEQDVATNNDSYNDDNDLTGKCSRRTAADIV